MLEPIRKVHLSHTIPTRQVTQGCQPCTLRAQQRAPHSPEEGKMELTARLSEAATQQRLLDLAG